MADGLIIFLLMKIYNEHKRRGRIWRAVDGHIGFYVVECRKCVKEMGADVDRAGGVEMVGIYFSGTGNTKYCVERFLACCDGEQEAVSIEDSWAVEAIRENEVIVLGIRCILVICLRLSVILWKSIRNIFLAKKYF